MVESEPLAAGFLAEASVALSGSLDPRRCMEIASRLAAGHLAEVAMVIAPATRQGWPSVLCRRGGEPVHTLLDIKPDDLPGLGEALQVFPPVPPRRVEAAGAPQWLRQADLGSILLAPLPGPGAAAGALLLWGGADGPVLGEREELFVRLFADRAGAAMSVARLLARQAAITETLLSDLLPPVLRQVSGVELAGRYRPAADSDRVGGDFYDVHSPGPTDQDELLAVLGDVCGKGLEAAVLTGKVRGTLRALLPMAHDHQQLLSQLNAMLVNAHGTRFVTLVLASVRRAGPSVQLRVSCAGHPPPLVVRTDGQVESAPTRGQLIGVLPSVAVSTAEVTLAPGDSCLLYTNGVTEARGGPLGAECFGEQRLRTALAECAGQPAETMVERIEMLAAQWVPGGDHDDMAVLAIAAPRGQHLTAVGGHGRGRYTA